MHCRMRQSALMLRAIAFNVYEPTKPNSEVKYEEEAIDWEKVAKTYSLFRLLRRLLAASCCLVSTLSFAIFVLSIKLYIERNEIFSEHKAYGGRESWKLIVPTFNSELSFCYFVIAASLLAWIVSDCGLIGACNNKQFILLQYILLSVLIISLSAAAITYNIRGESKTLDTAIERMFESFVENHYRSGKMDMLFNNVVDHVQEKHHCCGYRKNSEKEEIYPAYYTILYWLEMTEWGQLQARQISFSGESMIEYVPKSCCRNKTNANCNVGIFQDRLKWDTRSETNWTERIYTMSCNTFLNVASSLRGTKNAQTMTVVTILALLQLGSMFAALYLYSVIRRCHQSNAFLRNVNR